MHFYKKDGDQCLDMRGDLIITQNDNIVTTRVKSAAPSHVYNYRCIEVQKLSFRKKLKALWVCAKFIFDSKLAERLPKSDE